MPDDPGDPLNPLPAATALTYVATADELGVILALLGKGFTSYDSVFRVALHNLARQLGVEVPPEAFQLRGLVRPRGRRGRSRAA